MNTTKRQISTELLCLASLRQARADFFDQVVSAAEKARGEKENGELTREERKLLRSDGVAQIAEFFFAISEGGLTTAEDISGLLQRHNEDMHRLLDQCEKGYTRFGLSAARIREAMFKQHQIDMIAHESSHGVVTFDQRSIGKILTQVMSFESCRTLLVLLAEAGLISRRDFRSVVLISSNGKLEGLYKKHLSYVVNNVLAAARDQ